MAQIILIQSVFIADFIPISFILRIDIVNLNNLNNPQIKILLLIGVYQCLSVVVLKDIYA